MKIALLGGRQDVHAWLCPSSLVALLSAADLHRLCLCRQTLEFTDDAYMRAVHLDGVDCRRMRMAAAPDREMLSLLRIADEFKHLQEMVSLLVGIASWGLLRKW